MVLSSLLACLGIFWDLSDEGREQVLQGFRIGVDGSGFDNLGSERVALSSTICPAIQFHSSCAGCHSHIVFRSLSHPQTDPCFSGTLHTGLAHPNRKNGKARHSDILNPQTVLSN